MAPRSFDPASARRFDGQQRFPASQRLNRSYCDINMCLKDELRFIVEERVHWDQQATCCELMPALSDVVRPCVPSTCGVELLFVCSIVMCHRTSRHGVCNRVRRSRTASMSSPSNVIKFISLRPSQSNRSSPQPSPSRLEQLDRDGLSPTPRPHASVTALGSHLAMDLISRAGIDRQPSNGRRER